MKVKNEREVAQSCPTFSDPHGLQPTRLLHPWNFPGKSTGVESEPLPERDAEHLLIVTEITSDSLYMFYK